MNLLSLCKSSSSSSSSSQRQPLSPFKKLCGGCFFISFAVAGVFTLFLGILIQAHAPTLIFGQHTIHKPEEVAKLCFTVAVLHFCFFLYVGYILYSSSKLSARASGSF